MKQWRKYSGLDESQIDKISLSLATNKDIVEWSHGEVTKPETINYKTYKPEKSGLFDELIFGPKTDYKCVICGKKYKQSNENMICTNTELCRSERPEILPKISRRSRMGHIALETPVVHFWFFKIDHSTIFKLLGLTVEGTQKVIPKPTIENIIYYKTHIVLESGGLKSLPKNTVIEINDAAVIYKNALLEIRDKFEDKNSDEYIDITEKLEDLVELAESKIGKDYGIDFYELNEIIEEYSDAKIGTGSKAIEYLLENINLEEERDKVKRKIKVIEDKIYNDDKENKSKVTERDRLYKRLFVINSFINSGQKPTSMLIYNLPVIPADLRPLIQLDGGRHSTSDINELYRRIIIRNNRLKKWNELDSPKLIVQNELRMIQEAVDAVIDNARKTPNPVMAKDNRPLKSISDALVGKKGRFRQNLLGKRVDYSGRSVIVVGPNLKMHQTGIPRDMAAKLFEPWIIKELVSKNVVASIKTARKLIENRENVIWPHVENVIKNKLVLLNRAPTLHRLSIQAFEPVLIRGKAIKLHPLVTTAFNADFDGDQMAVHVPVSDIAIREARELMLASRNILGPKDGEPIINPSQDMLIGLYYLTMEQRGAKGEGRYFMTYQDMLKAYENKFITLHTLIALPAKEVKKDRKFNKPGFIISTVGRFIFNNLFPKNFEFIFDNTPASLHNNDLVMQTYFAPYGTNIKEFIKGIPVSGPLSKKEVAKIIRHAFDTYDTSISKEALSRILNEITLDNYYEKDVWVEKLANIRNLKGEKINERHVDILKEFIYKEFVRLNDEKRKQKLDMLMSIKDYVTILENVWFKYTNVVATILDGMKDLGFNYSTKSGTSIAISDIITLHNKENFIKDGESYIEKLKEAYNDGLLTDDERYELTIEKWTKVKDEIQKELQKITSHHPDNSLFMMMKSGARGKISNFVQLAGMRGLMANNAKTLKADAENERVVRSTVEVPVKASFLEGLSAYEFYSSTHGARKGLTDTALNTAKSGYLTRRLVDVAQSIVVREDDCGSDIGTLIKNIIDTKTNTIIVPFKERIEGRFSAQYLYGENGKIILEPNQLITDELAYYISDVMRVNELQIRSILSCHTTNGVCKKCFGKDLATNKIVSIGEAVGIIAAQSIGEPGTQLTMRTFHTGGVADAEDITGGFGRLIELIDAYDKPWGRPAEIAKYPGVIESIEEIKSKDNKNIVSNKSLITIKYNVNGESKYEKIPFRTNRRIRVKVGDIVKPGQKIIEGPIILKKLLEVTDSKTVQNYLLKEIQKLYRMQGIAISDKYIEIIIRQMLSKVFIQYAGDSKFFAGNLVDIHEYEKEAGELIAKNLRPPYGEPVIKGAKQTPLLSSSFLAAASYQETAKILVNASISNQVDTLQGLKENIILGHKIPAGTNANYEPESKYDIKNPAEYFKDKIFEIAETEENEEEDIEDINVDYYPENMREFISKIATEEEQLDSYIDDLEDEE
ncbi:DNA-directed RNA polymerase subunit beta' [Mycoplasma phocimorsus]|uniref:DNA-directed RNA polymerase subunit beta' n=1 Tax=Mycoplasma phocimorsus TaxID=3045839 RepID=A0AAJ1PT33_9MOLU|nr:DNA-directed RNA polymerase subunit beta' [Mycoplasma phocimorsus]MDJ1645697.1 DNA-directed RNA polymerase subunit beta' [Mycoplasma phocimorsus]MDJ1646517.1 DNA-directed RNA polymerase subunit beta' [Mycoplasma phocimorsus]MDJ1647096.1 DNA-directed RNA polymerase subunit beta' [Mycoplasma phocimorsus]MDJ1648516.1 DNA-directed RNA polymerase subunit beta' [Mycoplasma phocimorsus]